MFEWRRIIIIMNKHYLQSIFTNRIIDNFNSFSWSYFIHTCNKILLFVNNNMVAPIFSSLNSLGASWNCSYNSRIKGFGPLA